MSSVSLQFFFPLPLSNSLLHFLCPLLSFHSALLCLFSSSRWPPHLVALATSLLVSIAQSFSVTSCHHGQRSPLHFQLLQLPPIFFSSRSFFCPFHLLASSFHLAVLLFLLTNTLSLSFFLSLFHWFRNQLQTSVKVILRLIELSILFFTVSLCLSLSLSMMDRWGDSLVVAPGGEGEGCQAVTLTQTHTNTITLRLNSWPAWRRF